jgi:hypothetical protein
MITDMDVDVDGAAAAANLDLSTFELRWAEALGAADSDEVADFETAGASVGHVWRKESHECGSLRSAELTDFSDPEGMSFLDVGSNPLFLSLEKRGKYLLIRPFYESLYQQVVEKWSSDGEDRVLVLGNAGSGKSWFQPYALRKLFLGYGVEHGYLFVIRQVERSLFLIDLSDAQVRPIDVEMKWASHTLNLFNHKRVLYFFEPLSNRSILPLPLHLSSLTTLSPFEERTHEYEKNRLTQLIFPCWTLDHLSVAAKNDPDIPLELEEVADRFSRFGGIIRHVFAPNTQKYEENQRDRINGADLTILRATTTGIDSDPKAPGNNVSGYLLSYCNIATAGPDRFRHAVLDFTSDFVRGRIRERMKDYSIEEHIEIVVDHLNGEQTDRGGLHLQEAVSFLLAKGSKVAWQFKRVTDGGGGHGGGWSSFQTRVREVVKCYTISEHLGATDKVLVSTNPNFPLADIVFSHPPPTALLLSFRVTWQLSHPFTLRALYMLREIYLKIQDSVRIQVLFVTPGQEDTYAASSKQRFLKGNVDVDLEYTKNIRIKSTRLQEMWRNTEMGVLKPESSWISTLRPYR